MNAWFVFNDGDFCKKSSLIVQELVIVFGEYNLCYNVWYGIWNNKL